MTGNQGVAPKIMGGREGLISTSTPTPANGDNGAIKNRDYVSSLARGLEILRAFSRKRRRMTLSEVAAETGINRAAARRFLLTLVHEGYAVADGKLFDLTPQVLELGFSVLSSMGVWDLSRPFLERLAEEIEESVSAAVLDGSDVVYVCGAQYHRVISVGVTLGNRLPAYCTATGRVLLAERPVEEWDVMIAGLQLEPRTRRTVTSKTRFREILEEVREHGWALVDQELEAGLVSIAIPLRKRSGEVFGAINVGCPTVRATPADMVERMLPRLKDVAHDISQAIAR